MYLRILKKDLKRKKTMNVILFLFIVLATTFIASSINNIFSISTAMDSYFDKAKVPEISINIMDGKESEKFERFAKDKGYSYQVEDLFCYEGNPIKKNGKKIDYDNTFVVSACNRNITEIFDIHDQKISDVKDGEIYLSSALMNDFDIKEGDTISVGEGKKEKTFKLKGSTKDASFGSSMIGMTRCLVSENDFDAMRQDKDYCMKVYGINEKDLDAFQKDYDEAGITTVFDLRKDTLKTAYIMDMVIAAVLLIVSISLIIISLVILRFTIVFTMNEEFREIGVMKALGIKSQKIRGLYIVKYFAMSVIGGAIGFAISIPFGNMMIQKASENIIIKNDNQLLLNFVASLLLIGIVVGFCYLSTRKINRFKPVEAIRNGSNGERFKGKGILRLNKGHMRPICFMALNDILSEFRKFAIMILAFTIGILLVLIPVNTANTLRSDALISCMSMKECDICIADDVVWSEETASEEQFMSCIQETKDKLKDANIDADVFREFLFKPSRVSYKDKSCSPTAYQGKGDATAEDYTYIEGTAPKYENEIALTHLVQQELKAEIGDEIKVQMGDSTKKYLVTGIFQTMTNMGEGIRFSEKEEIDSSYVTGAFGIQIAYKDTIDEKERERRFSKIEKIFSGYSVYTPGDYINHMIGDVAGQIDSVKQLILLVVLLMNILVTVLMVKSFMTREKGEIGMLKAIGFGNSTLVRWQTLRIGIVLVVSTILATLVSAPLTKLSSGQVFKIMGLQTIEFEIVPLEVYVLYPLVVIIVTVLASFLTAQGVRKVLASETSNIE